MRVLSVSTFPPRRCGIGDYTADFAAELVKLEDINLRILTYRDGLEQVSQQDGFQVSRNLGRAPILENIAATIETFRPDIVHLQSSTFLHPPAVNHGIARACEVPLVTTVHDAPRSLRLFYMIPSLRTVYRKSARIIVHSTTVSHTLSTFHGVEMDRIVSIPHGVDLDRYSPLTSGEEARIRYGLEGKRVVLFFGFLRPGKGLERLLEAWSTIEKTNLDALLVIAGATPSRPRRYLLNLRDEAEYPTTLVQFTKDLGLTGRVEFTGYVPENLVAGLFALADVIVLPHEGLTSQSGPLHKAIASGRPVVASRGQATEELLESGETALLVPPGDPRSLADAINSTLSDSGLAARLAENARRLAEERLGWRIVVRLTAALYRAVVESA